LTQQASEPTAHLASSGSPAAVAPQGGSRQVVAWLAAQPGGAPQRVPDLEALGFDVVAPRVITTASGQPAAQLLYQDAAGQRVTLYMRAGGKAGQTSFTFTRDGDAAQFFWQDSHMAYSLVGKMAQEKLLRIAEAVSRSLRGDAVPPAAPPAAEPPASLESAVQSGDAKAAGPAPENPPAPATVPEIERGQSLPPLLPESIDLPKDT
jgi:hypothetical protein